MLLVVDDVVVLFLMQTKIMRSNARTNNARNEMSNLIDQMCTHVEHV